MTTWNGVITNAGNSLLNEWVNEKALNFDSAAAGQGTVAAAAMMAQTALSMKSRPRACWAARGYLPAFA